MLSLHHAPTAPDDYTGILDRALTFSTRLPLITVHVPIEDDFLVEEGLKRFIATLALVTDNCHVQIAPPITGVMLNPNSSEVMIIDNDINGR